jgi:PAS domain S-box-containing protein
MTKQLEEQLIRQYGSLQQVPKELSAFLKIVDRTYQAHDEYAQELTDTKTALLNVLEDFQHAKEETARSERFAQTVIDSSLDLITLTDPMGVIIAENRAVERLMGYKYKENVGKNVFNFIHPDDRARVMAEYAKGIEDPSYTSIVRYRSRTKDGTYKYFESWGKNLLSDDAIKAILVNSRDVTERMEAEQQLLVQESRFKAIIENGNDLIQIVDKDAQVKYAGPSITHMLGYDMTEVLGKWVGDYIEPSDLEPVKQAFIEAIPKEGAILRGRVRVRHKNGSYVHMEYSIQNLLHIPSIAGLVVHLNDISERIHSEERNDQLISIIERAPLFIGTSDRDGRVIYLNTAGREMVGLSASADVRDMNIQALHPEWAYNLLTSQGIPEAISKGFWTGHTAILGPKKEEIALVQTVVANKDAHGKVLYLSTIARDVSSEIQAEARIKELDFLKNKFIQIVSHQFRTPLNAIRWNLEALLSDEVGTLKPEQKEFIRVTHDANTDVINRIGDLLTALDIEEGRVFLQKDQVALESILASVVAEWTKKCDLKSITCEYIKPEQPLPLFSGDPEKIRMALNKLIENAIVYTPEHGKVRVALEIKSKVARITVEDSGIGIPKNEQPRMFERFYRASNAFPMKPDSSGLGLTIAKYFVEQHGGKIGFTSKEGKGTSFWIELPLR